MSWVLERLLLNPDLWTCAYVCIYIYIYIHMSVAQNDLHNKMTSSRKSKVPFAHTIASFGRSMLEAKPKP